MFRRIRKPNYSHEETMALLEQIEAHRHILFGKTTNHQRSELWAFIADTVNSVPNSTGRTVEELKHRWKDLSHKTRNSVRHFSETKSRSDQPFVAPSIYFDIVMRILGDGIFDKSEFNTTSCHDGQSLSPRFADDGRNFSSNSEIDVKPDLSTINNFIIADEKSHNLKMHLHSPSTSGIVVGKYLNTFNQNPSSSNEINSLTSTPSINFSGSAQRKCISELPHQNLGMGENPPHFNEPLPSSSGTGAVSAGKPFLWRPQAQAANLRPMRLDPVTREISEVDGLGLDSDSSEGDSSSSKMTISIAEGLVAGRVHSQENGEKSASSLPGHQARKRKKLNPSGLLIPSLSVEDLKKLYLVKRIKMIEQKTNCFKTLEQKFKCEINLLQQQAKSGSQPYFYRYSHNPKVARLPKNFNRNEENSQDGILLQEFDSKQRQSEDEICEQAMAVGGYCNDDDDVDNDGGSTTDGEVVCEQEESGSSGSHNEETPDSHEVKIAT